MNKTYILKIGLAFTLIYAGIDTLFHPYDWIGFVPTWTVVFGTSQTLALQAHSIFEALIGVLILTNWKSKWISIIVALDMTAILLVNGFGRNIFLVTFRDVGLLTIAIFLALSENEKK